MVRHLGRDSEKYQGSTSSFTGVPKGQYLGAFSYLKALPFPENNSKYTRKSLTVSLNPDIELSLHSSFMRSLWHLGVL